MAKQKIGRQTGRLAVPRPRGSLLATCRCCRKLHRPERPLAFNPVCAACTRKSR